MGLEQTIPSQRNYKVKKYDSNIVTTIPKGVTVGYPLL